VSKSRFVLKPARVEGSASSDLTRYIAKSKLDKRREGEHARPLFNDERDDLTFWEARKWLSITGGALPREDVLHYVLSFEVVKDYESLGKTDAERMAEVRAYLRRALTKAARQAGVESWRWAAGIHLNKPHPHVHLLINKNVVEARIGELRRVEKLPPPLVAHYKNRTDETREFDYGTIINSFAADVDARSATAPMNAICRAETGVKRRHPESARTAGATAFCLANRCGRATRSSSSNVRPKPSKHTATSGVFASSTLCMNESVASRRTTSAAAPTLKRNDWLRT
jgi:hypothetical protein